jgi:hypothetical protein
VPPRSDASTEKPSLTRWKEVEEQACVELVRQGLVQKRRASLSESVIALNPFFLHAPILCRVRFQRVKNVFHCAMRPVELFPMSTYEKKNNKRSRGSNFRAVCISHQSPSVCPCVYRKSAVRDITHHTAKHLMRARERTGLGWKRWSRQWL